jgi:DNA-directed RNA polymerase specialized sigma24 family protein
LKDLQQLLVESLPWLEKTCARRSRTRPDLEAEELMQEVVLRFIEHAPRWFAEEARYSRQAQGRALLKNLIWHIFTERDRRVKRLLIERASEAGDAIARLPALQTPVEERLSLAEVSAEVQRSTEGLKNPVYQLVVLAVYLTTMLTAPHIDRASAHTRGGARPLARSPEDTWRLLSQERRHRPEPEEEWKPTVADILRCETPLGAAPAAELRRARGWLDRTLHRARLQLAELLREHR